jgi:hypothetical protein
MEHILLHWDDIMACLIDELIEEEVIELNKIDKIRQGRNIQKTKLADRQMLGKFHDYKSVDLREILGIFEEYNSAATRIENVYN